MTYLRQLLQLFLDVFNNENMSNKFLLTLLWYFLVILMYFVIISSENKLFNTYCTIYLFQENFRKQK